MDNKTFLNKMNKMVLIISLLVLFILASIMIYNNDVKASTTKNLSVSGKRYSFTISGGNKQSISIYKFTNGSKQKIVSKTDGYITYVTTKNKKIYFNIGEFLDHEKVYMLDTSNDKFICEWKKGYVENTYKNWFVIKVGFVTDISSYTHVMYNCVNKKKIVLKNTWGNEKSDLGYKFYKNKLYYAKRGKNYKSLYVHKLNLKTKKDSIIKKIVAIKKGRHYLYPSKVTNKYILYSDDGSTNGYQIKVFYKNRKRSARYSYKNLLSSRSKRIIIGENEEKSKALNYKLLDLNGDGVSELVLTNNRKSDYQTYTAVITMTKNNYLKTICFGLGKASKYYKKKHILKIGDIYYKINKNGSKKIYSTNYLDDSYKIKNKRVSERSFKNKIRKLGRARRIKFKKNTKKNRRKII